MHMSNPRVVHLKLNGGCGLPGDCTQPTWLMARSDLERGLSIWHPHTTQHTAPPHIFQLRAARETCAGTNTHQQPYRLWQNDDNHHTGQFGTLSATVAPFEEWKTTNLRYRISPCYYTLAVHFLPFFHNIPWVWCSYTLAELTKKSLHILVWFSSAVIYSKKNRYLPRYWLLTRLTKRSKGRCRKSAPPHMLALGTILFPQASGTNAGGSALGNDSSYGAEKSRACIHIALLAPFKTGKPCLSRAILDLLCIYWLLALLPRTISPPKMWVIFSNEHLLTKSRKKNPKETAMRTESRLELLMFCTIYSPEGQLKSALLHSALSSCAFALPLGRKGARHRAGAKVYCPCRSKLVGRANRPVKWWDVQSYVMGHMGHCHLKYVSPAGINFLPRVSPDGGWQLGHGGLVIKWVISTQACGWFGMQVNGDCPTDSPLDGGLSRSESRWIGGAM